MPGDISLSLKAQLALQRAGFDYTRSLGQNFIFDEELLNRIADCAGIEKGVNVLEIGPGAGLLTAIMAERNANVLSIELDKTLEPVLQETVGEYGNVRIVYADALRADLSALLGESFGNQPYRVCANLPYYITTDFIQKAVMLEPMPTSVTLMLQAEAAQRILAAPGDEGWCALSAIVSFYCEGEKLLDVSREAFTPRPHVDSALIRLTARGERLVPPERSRAFAAFIKSAFVMRRKTLVNNVSSSYSIPKERAAEALQKLGIDLRMRGEALSLDELSRVFFALTGDV